MTEKIDFIRAVLRFKRTIAGFASTQEHGTGLDEEVTADAAAFLEYLKGIENRFVAAEARVAELEAEATRLRQELEVQQGRAKTLLNRNSAQAARMRPLLARAEAAEGQLARQAFVTDRLPPADELVEVLMLAQWEPRIVPEAPGRWRDRRFETLNGVQGWRLLAEATEAQQ